MRRPTCSTKEILTEKPEFATPQGAFLHMANLRHFAPLGHEETGMDQTIEMSMDDRLLRFATHGPISLRRDDADPLVAHMSLDFLQLADDDQELAEGLVMDPLGENVCIFSSKENLEPKTHVGP